MIEENIPVEDVLSQRIFHAISFQFFHRFARSDILLGVERVVGLLVCSEIWKFSIDAENLKDIDSTVVICSSTEILIKSEDNL